MEKKTPEQWNRELRTAQRIGTGATIVMGVIALGCVIACKIRIQNIKSEYAETRSNILRNSTPSLIVNDSVQTMNPWFLPNRLTIK